MLRSFQYYALPSIILCGILLRIAAAANTELRFDELISLDLVSVIQSPWNILLTLHHDNNHPLASFVIFVVGVGKYTPAIWYRVAPILSSLFGMALFFLILKKRANSSLPALIGVALFSSSLLSITLSSEIRGYSFAATSALFAFFLHSSRRDLLGAIGFTVASCIGLLAHATYILFFTAMGVADLILLQWSTTTQNQRKDFSVFCGRYGCSSLFLILVYIVFYRHLPPVSAPIIPWNDTVASTLSLTFGGPWISMISRPIYLAVWIYAAIGAWVLGNSLRKTVLFRPDHLHLLLIIIVVPFFAILIICPQAIAERYLYLPVTFSYLVIAEYLVSLILNDGWKRYWGITIMTLILGGNLAHSACFAFFGTGRMHDLIQYCHENRQTINSPLLIGGDHDLRIGLPLKRIAAEYPALAITYVEQITHQTNEVSAEWIISHYIDRAYIPPLRWRSLHGEEFSLVKTFPNYSLNGWPLFLYRSSTKTKELQLNTP